MKWSYFFAFVCIVALVGMISGFVGQNPYITYDETYHFYVFNTFQYLHDIALIGDRFSTLNGLWNYFGSSFTFADILKIFILPLYYLTLIWNYILSIGSFLLKLLMFEPLATYFSNLISAIISYLGVLSSL